MHINSQRRISYALQPTLGSTSSGWLAGIFRLPVLHGWCAFNMCEIWDVAQVGQPSGGQWTPLPGWPGGLHATVCFLGMKQNKIQPYWVLNELYTDGKRTVVSQQAFECSSFRAGHWYCGYLLWTALIAEEKAIKQGFSMLSYSYLNLFISEGDGSDSLCLSKAEAEWGLRSAGQTAWATTGFKYLHRGVIQPLMCFNEGLYVLIKGNYVWSVKLVGLELLSFETIWYGIIPWFASALSFLDLEEKPKKTLIFFQAVYKDVMIPLNPATRQGTSFLLRLCYTDICNASNSLRKEK